MAGKIKFPQNILPYIKELITDDFGVISFKTFYNKEPEFSIPEFYEFVECDRQSSVFFCVSAYFDNFERILELEGDILSCQFSMKNYMYELEKFIKWLRAADIPHNLVTRYEECYEDTHHFYKWESEWGNIEDLET